MLQYGIHKSSQVYHFTFPYSAHIVPPCHEIALQFFCILQTLPAFIHLLSNGHIFQCVFLASSPPKWIYFEGNNSSTWSEKYLAGNIDGMAFKDHRESFNTEDLDVIHGQQERSF